MKRKIILFFALFTLSVSSTFAHALWIETAGAGKKGIQQTVKVFFGEYEGDEPDSTKKWFSNMSKFSLLLTAPNGKTQVLSTSADVFYYQAHFTPDQNGVYLLSIVHEVADTYDNAKIEYYAFANIAIGDVKKANTSYPSTAQLIFQPHYAVATAGGQIDHQLSFNKKAFAKQKVGVIDPARKKQEITTDADGKLSVKPVVKGNYFLEAFYEDKTAGTLGTKKFDKVWHVATYFTKID